jgi:hypothetical protein
MQCAGVSKAGEVSKRDKQEKWPAREAGKRERQAREVASKRGRQEREASKRGK